MVLTFSRPMMNVLRILFSSCLVSWYSRHSAVCIAFDVGEVRTYTIRKQLSLICSKVAILSSALTIGYTSPSYASNLENGAVMFSSSCAGCHAGGGNLFARGQTLFTKDLVKNGRDNTEAMTAYILKGKGQMPAYGSFVSPKGNVMPAKYTTDEVSDISDYVLDQASRDWVVAK